MPLLSTFAAALGVLKTQLAPLSSDVSLRLDDTFPAPYVDVVLLSDSPNSYERVGRAAILLSGTDESAPDWGFYARRATVLASCMASEFAGGLEQTDRAPLQELIANALQSKIENGYTSTRDAGILNSRARRARQGVSETSDSPGVHFVDVEITFVYLTQ